MFEVHFQGRQLCHFHFCSPSRKGSVLEGGVCFHRSNLFPSYVGLNFGRALSAGKANRKSQNMSSPSERMASGGRRADVDATSLRSINVTVTPCARCKQFNKL